MSTQYLNELIAASSCAYYDQQSIWPQCYYNFVTGHAPGGGTMAPGVNNSGNLNLLWDIEISYRYIPSGISPLGTTPTGGLYVYLIASTSGGAPISYANTGNYEDGLAFFNDGQHGLTGPVTTPDSHNLIDVISPSDTGYHKVVLKDIAIDPYVLIPVVYNNDQSYTGLVSMNILGKFTQTVGP